MIHERGHVILSKAALGVVISTCLAIGTAGSFIKDEVTRYVVRDASVSPKADEWQSPPVLSARLATIEARQSAQADSFDVFRTSTQRSLERIEGKLDKAIADRK